MDLPLYLGAFVAGVLMFLAPCTLPIVPGYLAFIAGVPAGGMGQDSARRRILINALAFVLGFSIVFILLGSFAAAIGAVLGPWRPLIARGAGLVIILFGLSMLGLFSLPILSGEHRMRLPSWLALGHWHSSMLVGALFALGWSPCIGPVLATVLYMASVSATAAQGALLLAIFSLGLGLPFILCALALGQADRLVARLGPLTTMLTKLGGAVLVLLGLLMLTGNTGLLIQWGFGAFDAAGYSKLLNYL